MKWAIVFYLLNKALVLERLTLCGPQTTDAPGTRSTAGLTMGLKQAVNMARIMQWFMLTYANGPAKLDTAKLKTTE